MNVKDEHFGPNTAALRTEIRNELAALERYEAQHGSFPALVRAHYERDCTRDKPDDDPKSSPG
jgi:hypothetical protein